MGELFFLGGVFCALLTVYILLFKENALRSYADYILSAFLILQCYCTILYLLVFSAWITYVPHLYKTAAPINYLLPPLCYLYVRVVLYNEKRIKLIDSLHFMPFILFLVNYLPFYLLPFDQKKIIVDQTTKNFALAYQLKAGFLPEYIPYLARITQAILYIFFQWKLILSFKKLQQNMPIEIQAKNVIKWVKVITWASTISIIGFFSLILLTIFPIDFITIGFINLIPGSIIALSFFVISFYLLVNPEVITGLPFIQYKELDSVLIMDESNRIPFIREDYHQEIDAIDAYFKLKQPYLINNISINQIAIVLNIPVRDLSYIINNYYSMRFTDFVNKYRIDHIIENFNSNDINTYTLESLAKQSGFSSKSSFYRAFNKVHNCTPLEYFNSK